VEGDTGRYPSSEMVDRVFCKTCGTRLFAWRKNPAVAGVAIAAFDDRNAFAPTEHTWVSDKMDWVRLDDGLPQHLQSVPQ
jgi:hypothetical protein